MSRDQILNHPIADTLLALRDGEGSTIMTVKISAQERKRFVDGAVGHNAEHQHSGGLHKVRAELTAGLLVLNSVFGPEVTP